MGASVRIRCHGRRTPLVVAAAIVAVSFCAWPLSFSVGSPPNRPASKGSPSAEARPEAGAGMGGEEVDEDEEVDVVWSLIPRGSTTELGSSGVIASQVSVEAREIGIPEEQREEWIREKVAKKENERLCGRLKRMAWTDARGEIDYRGVLFAATSLPWSEVHNTLIAMPKLKADREKTLGKVLDRTHQLCCRLRKKAIWPQFHYEYPRISREEARVQQRVEDMCERITDLYFKDTPIDFEKVGKAAVNVPIVRISRAFHALALRNKDVQDPTAFLVAEIRPHRVNQDTLGPILNTPSHRNTVRKTIFWLNSFGGFEGALDYHKIVFAAAAVGASMRTMLSVLRRLRSYEGKKEDGNGYAIRQLIRITERYKDLEVAAAKDDSESIDRDARFEAANTPLGGASDASKDFARVDAAL